MAVIRDSLSDRDWAILGTVAAHRFLTTRQVQAFHFTDHTSDLSAARVCRRVLARLRRDRLLATVQRRVGGVRAGSASFVWHLDAVGDRLLRQSSSARPRRRSFEPSLHFLQHTLAVADLHLQLRQAASSGAIELLQVATEPDCHRRYPHLGGGLSTLKPDLYAVTATSEFEDSWFFEVDLGTESLPRLLAKCAEYETYRRSGVEQQTSGVFPIVVWLIREASRRAALTAAIANERSLPTELFRVLAPGELPALVAGGTP
ncbi:replication-relaxation family protein [Rhodococcus sp. NPDC060084]|uniref:replication-relaxation family protein n=1 Tax=Rhodococcus sp. NPDC060084 TaxID=3347053 RepID=UPI0036517A68